MSKLISKASWLFRYLLAAILDLDFKKSQKVIFLNHYLDPPQILGVFESFKTIVYRTPNAPPSLVSKQFLVDIKLCPFNFFLHRMKSFYFGHNLNLIL